MLRAGKGVGEIVGCTLLVPVHTHGPIPLVGLGLGPVRTVDRNLVEVGPQAMAMGVRVGEQATLKY